MKFQIKSQSFERLGDATEYGTIPLRSLPDGRCLFLKAEAAPILDITDKWMDFEKFVAGSDDEKRRDYEDALTLLSCFGIAKVMTEPTPDEGVFVAGEREYGEVSDFCLAVRHAEGNILLNHAADDRYFSLSAVRERQFNNLEYHFMYKKDGAIRALMNISMMPDVTLPTAVILSGLLFPHGTDKVDRQTFTHALLSYTAAEFGKDFLRMRFLHKIPRASSVPRFDETLRILKNEGFKKTAVLTRELPDGGDVHIYDYVLYDGPLRGSMHTRALHSLRSQAALIREDDADGAS